MSDPLDMKGKAVIVTGGSSGVGWGITTRFFEVGAEACRQLLGLIENGKNDDEPADAIHERLPVSLVQRGSCCRPPST